MATKPKTTKPKKPVPDTPHLFERVRVILESARINIARTVNTTQVVANWLIGREIVEEEQQGKRRAGYGAELLRELAARLKADFGSGYGVDNLELFRRFYLEYPQLLPEVNSDALRRKSGTSEKSETVRRNSDASVEGIRRRFAAGLRNFENIYRDAVDAWAIYDNAGDEPLLINWGEKP